MRVDINVNVHIYTHVCLLVCVSVCRCVCVRTRLCVADIHAIISMHPSPPVEEAKFGPIPRPCLNWAYDVGHGLAETYGARWFGPCQLTDTYNSKGIVS